MTEKIMITLPATKPMWLPLLYVVFFFSVTGLYLFGGTLDNRCRISEEPLEDDSWPVDES